jgi:voltage-gated potassium channel
MLYRREISFLRQFLKFALGYLIVLIILSFFLQVIEGFDKWSFLDAFYQIVITVSTVGFGEVKPLSPLGRIYITAIIFLQTGFFVYITSKIVDLAVSGELAKIIRFRKLQSMLKNMENHIIVIGLGRLGKSLIETLNNLGEKVVGVDKDTEKVKQLSKIYPHIPLIDCNAQEEECLKLAKIGKAKSIVLTISSDAENLFIVVTAKNLNPDINIVSRVNNTKNIRKLKQAGAHEVFLPEIETGRLVAMLLEKPNVSKLLNVILLDEENPFDIEEFEVKPCSSVVNHSVGEIFKNNVTGVLIAIKRGETFLVFPAKEELIRAGDILIVIGDLEQLTTVKTLIEC